MSNGSFCLVFALKIHFAHFSAQGVHACVSECVRAQHSLHEPCEPTTLSEKEKNTHIATGWKRVVVSWINWERCVALDSWKILRTQKHIIRLFMDRKNAVGIFPLSLSTSALTSSPSSHYCLSLLCSVFFHHSYARTHSLSHAHTRAG